MHPAASIRVEAISTLAEADSADAALIGAIERLNAELAAGDMQKMDRALGARSALQQTRARLRRRRRELIAGQQRSTHP